MNLRTTTIMTSRVYDSARQRDAEQLKRDGWCQRGIFAVSASDARLSREERALILKLGERLYGGAGRGGGHGPRP